MRRIKFVSPHIDGALKEREIKEAISNIYIPCPCGSGKKYKFCCYGKEDKKFHSPNELYMYVVKQKNKKEFCMHSDEKCNKKIVKAHSIQNNKILSKLATEGTGYRLKTRFAKFYNLPELMMMFREVADIQTADMLNLPVPEAEYRVISVKPSDMQREMVTELGERAERVRNGMVNPTEDNMLLISVC